jgi:hypothetical protein
MGLRWVGLYHDMDMTCVEYLGLVYRFEISSSLVSFEIVI